MKYKVGDIVRVKTLERLKIELGPKLAAAGCHFDEDMKKYCGKIVTIDKITCLDNSIEKYLLYEDVIKWRFHQDFLEPFDGFRVGDDVWTVKRGKGVIHQCTHEPNRLFQVGFDAWSNRWCYPKLYNLIPTEKLYNEAILRKGRVLGCQWFIDQIIVETAIIFGTKGDDL